MLDRYVEENRGFITASKLKLLAKSPEEYFLKYVKELPSEEDDKTAFVLGNAIDYFISYGEKAFYNKYFIDQWFVKAKLIEEIFKQKWEVANPKDTVDTLKTQLYGDISQKIRLTEAESKKVLGVIREFKRQPLFDFDGEKYQKQYEVVAQYKSLKLRGKLDRFLKVDDKTCKNIDTKTTGDLLKFPFQAYNELWYDISMGFYSKLIEISLGLKTESYLFVAQTKTSYASKFYRVPEEIIRNAIETKILPLLELANSLHVAWEETKDENIWKVRVPTDNVIDSEFYHLMDSTIQTKIEDLN